MQTPKRAAGACTYESVVLQLEQIACLTFSLARPRPGNGGCEICGTNYKFVKRGRQRGGKKAKIWRRGEGTRRDERDWAGDTVIRERVIRRCMLTRFRTSWRTPWHLQHRFSVQCLLLHVSTTRRRGDRRRPAVSRPPASRRPTQRQTKTNKV